MGITNKQYNQIIREYERLRLSNIHSLDKRTAEVYKKIPEIREIHNEISSLSVREAKARLLAEDVKPSDSKNTLKEKIIHLSEQKKRLQTILLCTIPAINAKIPVILKIKCVPVCMQKL